MKARIIGTGSFAPEKILTNIDLENFLDTSDEWIVTRTGIRQRHIASDGEATSDLATQAARNALEMAGVSPEELDLIIVGSITGDYPFPATACLVQKNLGARNAFAYDLSAACSGFIYGLSNADQYHKSGAVRKSLVIGAETMTRTVDWKDRATCVLFGDGAGAVVLETSEGDSGILSTHLHSDGSSWELLYQPGFGSRNPPSAEGLEEGVHYLKMQGNEVFKMAVRSLSDVVAEALEANGLSKEEVTLIFPHQANKRILDATGKRLQVPPKKIYSNVDSYANTSAASIPIALDEANRNGKIQEGDVVVLNAFGGGFTWGAALIRW
jgi:3-oxoacyl-[acyl-carrier-protein] synthase-3